MSRQVLKVIAFCLIVLTLAMGCVLVNLYKNMQNTNNYDTKQDYDVSTEKEQEVIYQSEPESRMIIDEKPESMYTYDDMESDLKRLSEKYKNILTLNTLTQTADNRYVYDAVAGNPNSENQYIITASIHAREYITTKLTMKLLIDFLEDYSGNDVLFHFIPMVNPDGVSISQLGEKGIKNTDVLNKITEIARSDGKTINDANYLRQWKANANGVDLNRNFDALWDEYNGPSHPSSDRYKGIFPGSENETAALIKLTKDNPIKCTVSYHTMGEVIYWYFAQTGELLEKTQSLAKQISNSTGYKTDSNYKNLDPAGYKDWAISALKIPSVTIEVGHGDNPVDESQINEIYLANKDILKVITQ